MSTSVQAKCASRTGAVASRARCVRVQASKANHAAAVAAAAAMVLVASPAYAGVVLQQPVLKKAFISDNKPVAEKPATPQPKAVGSGGGFSFFGGGAPAAAPAAPKPKVAEEPMSDGGLDPRTIALPGCIAAVGGLVALAKAVDSEFEDFLNATLIKDNAGDGLGYEERIKSTAGGIYGPATGTKKVKAAKKK